MIDERAAVVVALPNKHDHTGNEVRHESSRDD